MSRAAAKLNSDGSWHPFSTTPHSWYRVWQKKLIQRVQFESEAEESEFKDRMDHFEPLPEIATEEGFREELVLHSSENGLTIRTMLGYPISEEAFAHIFNVTLSSVGLGSEVIEGLLFLITPVEEFRTEIVAKKQEVILGGRLLYTALSRGENPQYAVAVFLRQFSTFSEP